jgi:dTDP-4-amino-4,6-dideoxygalactose transaminase
VVSGTPAGTDVIRLAWPALGEEELAAVAEVLESGQLTMGPRVAEFEEELARVCEVEHAVAVSSGTAALHLAVLALGIGPGDEVIVPAYTFPATANVVALAGARPVLVDVDPETMNLRPDAVTEAVTDRTRAVLVVHLFGRPARWDEIEAAVPDGVVLIEDAAGALGARRGGRACGGLGRLGCLSFHPRKIVTTGEGGAVTTKDGELAETIRTMRHHGWRDADMRAPGLNYRLPDIPCALGVTQLRRLEQLLEERERLARAYRERLEGRMELPSADEGDRHGWQAYVVRVDRRDEALTALREAGIEAQIGTYALHRLSAYRDQGPFSGADAAYERALALPFHNRLTEEDLDRIAEVLTGL